MHARISPEMNPHPGQPASLSRAAARAPCRVRRAIALWAALAALCSTGARAQLLEQPPPPLRLVLTNLLAVRYDPLGLSDELRIALRLRLFQSDSPALRDNFVAAGAYTSLSPAILRAGLLAEVQPLTIFKLYAQAELVRFLGNFGAFQSFPSARSGFSEQTIRDQGNLPAGDPRRNYPVTGSQITLGASLKLKLAALVLTNTLELAHFDFPLRAGDRVFVDPTYDLLAPNGGFVFANDVNLFWQLAPGLLLGVHDTVSGPLYRSQDYAPGEPQVDPGNSSHRLGPIAVFTFFQRDGARYNAPTIFAVANWYLKHRYRAGAETSQAIPYLALGFAFWGDLLPLEPR